MDRRAFVSRLAFGLLAAPPAAEAQQAGKVARISYLLQSPLTEKPSAERQAFLQGLRELGYAEGHNVIIEYRSAAWNLDLLPDLAAELVERSVDVILAAGSQPTLAARGNQDDPDRNDRRGRPCRERTLTSLARPGAVPAAPAGLRCAGLGA
jgi:putative ABC transport system substrate-binding protein